MKSSIGLRFASLQIMQMPAGVLPTRPNVPGCKDDPSPLDLFGHPSRHRTPVWIRIRQTHAIKTAQTKDRPSASVRIPDRYQFLPS